MGDLPFLFPVQFHYLFQNDYLMKCIKLKRGNWLPLRSGLGTDPGESVATQVLVGGY